MLDAVFISDLHLNPDQPAITQRFFDCLDWVLQQKTKALYILGDFFHAWAGDDGIDDFCQTIITGLKALSQQGVSVYLMPGNRDFLLGQDFCNQAQVHLINDPTVIHLGHERVLVAHGDRYCTNDKMHQWLRRLTRNRLFPALFMRTSLPFRQKIVGKARQLSQKKMTQWATQRPSALAETVDAALIKAMRQTQTTTLIHGHTHQPKARTINDGQQVYAHYILSDWDDNPHILCYDYADGFYFCSNYTQHEG